MSAPLFPLGQIVTTQDALAASRSPWQVVELLARHVCGDWGCVSVEDAQSNRLAVREGDRILSAYPINPEEPCAGYGENCLWIITEVDRSVTTILLPQDY